MPYIQRDEAGNINGVFANAQDFASEFLPDDDAEVVAFLAPPQPADAELQAGKGDVIAKAEGASLQDQIDALSARMSAIEAKAG